MRTALAAVAGLGLVAALHTRGQLFPQEGLGVLGMLVPVAILVAVLWRRTGRPTTTWLRCYAPHLLLAAAMLAFLFSSATQSHRFYLLHYLPGPGRPARDALMVRWVFYTALFTPLFLLRLRRLWILLAAILLCGQYLSFTGLLEQTGGLALYRMDHPSFMFRLHEFTSVFPQLVNYNPHWNAGSLHYYSVTTGIGGPGLILFPLWRSAPIHEVYTCGVAILFILIVPWVAGLSVRAAGGDKAAAFTGAILGLGVSQQYFLWMLHYGTIGAAFTSMMVLPVAALAFRTMRMGRTGILQGLALVTATWLLLMWPPGAVMGVPIFAALLLHARWWSRRRWIFLITCGLAVLALHGRWLLVLLGEAGDVVGYVLRDDRVVAEGPPLFAWLHRDSLINGWEHLLGHLGEVHPILIFFGILGVFCAARGGLRSWFGVILLGLLLLTGWGREWKPDFQLTRMALPMCFVAVVPASILVSRMVRQGDQRLSLVRAGLVALLATGAYSVSKVYANQGPAPYAVLGEQVKEMTAWLRENTPPDARIMLSGKSVHGYGGAQAAYLPVLADREMMACDYYNFPMDTVEYDYPPSPWRKSSEGIDAFVEAYNVSHVMTYHDRWKRHYRGETNRYAEVYRMDRISIFRIDRQPRQLLKGDGSVRADFNRLQVDLNAPAEEVVLSYNWLEGLHAEHPDVEVYPYPHLDGITLIGVRPNQRTSFALVFR